MAARRQVRQHEREGGPLRTLQPYLARQRAVQVQVRRRGVTGETVARAVYVPLLELRTHCGNGQSVEAVGWRRQRGRERLAGGEEAGIIVSDADVVHDRRDVAGGRRDVLDLQQMFACGDSEWHGDERAHGLAGRRHGSDFHAVEKHAAGVARRAYAPDARIPPPHVGTVPVAHGEHDGAGTRRGHGRGDLPMALHVGLVEVLQLFARRRDGALVGEPRAGTADAATVTASRHVRRHRAVAVFHKVRVGEDERPRRFFRRAHEIPVVPLQRDLFHGLEPRVRHRNELSLRDGHQPHVVEDDRAVGADVVVNAEADGVLSLGQAAANAP